jgi:hypothetical protein
VSNSEVLLTIAEVAVAFAGFASLVGMLGQQSAVDDPRVLGVRMRAMLLSSLFVVMFSLFPLVLNAYGLHEGSVWIASSLILVLTAILYLRWLVRSLRSLGVVGIRPSRFQIRVVVPILFFSVAIVCILLLVNVFVASPGIYLTGLSLLLIQSGFAFCLIVFSFLPRLEMDAEGAGDDEGRP